MLKNVILYIHTSKRCLENLKNESGRSMVEMLGTLAIMGLLGITGVQGYTTAMRRHRANELINEANKRAVMVATDLMVGKSPENIDLTGYPNSSNTTFSNTITKEGDKFKLTVTGVDEKTCEYMENLSGGAIREIKCKKDDGFSVEFTFNEDLSSTDNTNGESGDSGPHSTADGWTGDKPDSDCTDDTKLGGDSGCQVCVSSSYVDSDAKCPSGQICLDGTCTAPADSTGTGCLKNSDCEKIDPTNCSGGKCFCGYYVYEVVGDITNVDSKNGPKAANGTCLVTADYKNTVNAKDDGITGTLSTKDMDWFSAKNFCQAVGGSMISLSGSFCDNEGRDCDWDKYKGKLTNTYWWTKNVFETSVPSLYASKIVNPAGWVDDGNTIRIVSAVRYSESHALCK